MYRLRAQYLYENFKKNHRPQGITTIDSACALSNMISKVCSSYDCAMRTETCEKCKISNETFLKYITVSVSADCMKNLEDIVRDQFQPKLLRKKCTHCGERILETVTGFTHLIMDMVDVTNKNALLTTTLQHIPERIVIDSSGSIYSLRGIIDYHGSGEGIGHFTALCLRNNTSWQKYDDLKLKVQDVKPTKAVNIQAMIYTL